MTTLSQEQKTEIAHCIRDFARELADMPIPLDDEAYHHVHAHNPWIVSDETATPTNRHRDQAAMALRMVARALEFAQVPGVVCDGKVYRVVGGRIAIEDLSPEADRDGTIDVSDTPLRKHTFSIADLDYLFREDDPEQVDLTLETDLYAITYRDSQGNAAIAEGTRDQVAAQLRSAGYQVRTTWCTPDNTNWPGKRLPKVTIDGDPA